MDPCPTCKRLVRNEDSRCVFCARRGVVVAMGIALIAAAVACEPKTQDVSVDPAPSTTTTATTSATPPATVTPSATASTEPTPSVTASATASATTSAKPKDSAPRVPVRPMQALYGCPPPPDTYEVV
ncbi:hypothetical protein BH09MYX1_BH09MYX1_65010 [soil metagenome]